VAVPVRPSAAVGIPAELLRRRPDIRQAELDAAAQSAQIGVAKADLLPAFSLVGNVGTLSSDIGRGSLSDIFTATSNLAGVPALSMPIGRSDGLPVGGQVIAKHFNEPMMFRVAYALEQALGAEAHT